MSQLLNPRPNKPPKVNWSEIAERCLNDPGLRIPMEGLYALSIRKTLDKFGLQYHLAFTKPRRETGMTVDLYALTVWAPRDENDIAGSFAQQTIRTRIEQLRKGERVAADNEERARKALNRAQRQLRRIRDDISLQLDRLDETVAKENAARAAAAKLIIQNAEKEESDD